MSLGAPTPPPAGPTGGKGFAPSGNDDFAGPPTGDGAFAATASPTGNDVFPGPPTGDGAFAASAEYDGSTNGGSAPTALTGPPAGSAPTTPTLGTRWRAGRWAALIAAIIVLVAIGSVLLGPEQREARRLDPGDTSLSGSKALAELLRERGITVDRVDSVAAAAAKGAGRLLLITTTAPFNAHELAQIPGDRVVIGGFANLGELAPGVEPLSGRVHQRSREPECALPAARAAGSAFRGPMAFSVPRGATGCYPAGEGWTLVSVPTANGTTTIVGSGEFLTNLRLAEDGNAALALNLIGTGKPVTWLMPPEIPQAGTLPGESGRSSSDLIPAGVPWAVLMACLSIVLVALWRGRRLGPVVVERLPVVVRAAETVEGRGRLYRARRARGRAADSLRAGAVDRLTPRLGLASGADRREVVAAVAVRTGQDSRQVGGALYGPPPVDDAELVALAGYLDYIERTVRER